MIEVEGQINAVQRRVGTRVLEAGEARTVTVSQTYDATVEDVWDACTNPERIPRWFLPISGDLRPGGRYELKGNASGTVQECDPPNSFAATWGVRRRGQLDRAASGAHAGGSDTFRARAHRTRRR